MKQRYGRLRYTTLGLRPMVRPSNPHVNTDNLELTTAVYGIELEICIHARQTISAPGTRQSSFTGVDDEFRSASGLVSLVPPSYLGY